MLKIFLKIKILMEDYDMKKKFNWNGKFGPMLIAEIGGNHEGDFNYAVKLTKLAISSGADVVKFQIYTGNSLVNKYIDKARNEHFKRFELSPEQHVKLAKICKKNGVIYSASVWNTEALKWINKYIKFYKIGSGDLTAYPVLGKICETNKPILLSTGLSNLNEIRNTIKFLVKKNSIYKRKNMIALLQCTSMYPTSDYDININVIDRLKNYFNIPVGYSDHSIGDFAVLLAALKGADILEFHFTDNRAYKKFRDHKVSLNPKELKNLCNNLTRAKIMLGKNEKKLLLSEKKSGHVKSFRRAIYFNRNIKSQELIKEEDLVCLRPNQGLDARKYKKIINTKSKKNYKAFDKIKI